MTVELQDRNRRKTRVGIVVSDKMDKTVVVALEDFVRHSLYGKSVKTTKKVKAHEHQETDGNWLLPWNQTPKRPPCKRSKNQNQRKNPKGSQKDRWPKQEEVGRR